MADETKRKTADETENPLQMMTEQWMQLERKTTKQREAADLFYEKKLMNLIEDNFIARNRERVEEEVEYLIMSVGTSYEPLVLSIKLLNPQKILFLCTAITEKYLDKIVKHCNLPVSAFQKCMVSETEPMDIYREIKKAYIEWGKPEKLHIDITGGTKAMSAAAAMAGAVIDIQLIYVGSNHYLPDFRKPCPGSETLFYIANPLSVFGDLEIEKAFTLLRKKNYSGAREKLEYLKEVVPEPNIRQQLNFAYLLAKSYEKWDSLELSGAYQTILKLNKELKRDKRINSRFLLMDKIDILKQQEEILAALSEIPQYIAEKRNAELLQKEKYIVPLMFTMCQNAMIREEQEKLDMATLLLYRLLEMIEQKRLAGYNLYVSKMNYKEIKVNTQIHPEWDGIDAKELFRQIKERYLDMKIQLFGKTGNTYMPEQISLLEGFILLAALDDEMLVRGNSSVIDKLKRIRAMVYLRNNSIFAHGLGPVSQTDYLKFKSFVLELFREFCDIEQINFAQYNSKMTWITPFDSVYYSGLEGN